MGAKIIILRGNAGSGKSTIASTLKSTIDKEIMYLEQDTFRHSILKVRNDENFGITRNVKAQGAILSLIHWGIDNCDYIIMDGIYSTPKYIPMFDEINKLNTEIYAYYFDIPFEETAKRHSTRDKAKLFDAETMREWYREHNYMPNLKETIITKDQSKNDIINMILNDIGEN